MERLKCQNCGKFILGLKTKAHIQFGGKSPPVEKDGLCPVCWKKANPGKPLPILPGW